MKLFSVIALIGSLLLTGASSLPPEEVELVCLKTHKASNTCYYNFKINGMKYHYVDAGCKMSKKKKDEVIGKAKDGKLGLARDWKISCPENAN